MTKRRSVGRPRRRCLGPQVGGRPRRWTRLGRILAVVLGASIVVAACGDSDPVSADPAVAPFVGAWEASEFTITNSAEPDQTFDITDGGSFTIDIQPSGNYTATLLVEGLPDPEVEYGQLSVSGSTVVLDPDEGPPASATFTFEGDDRLILDGPTEFDFNFDGEPEDAEAYIVLERS